MRFKETRFLGFVLGLGLVLGLGCTLSGPDSSPDELDNPDQQSADNQPEFDCSDCQELSHANTKLLVQPGGELLLLAVTDDNHAVYQDGQTVYATALRPNATRVLVTEVPGTTVAFPLQVDNVVFLWTQPQAAVPGLGVSPLVVWSAATGPQHLSEQSTIGTIVTAASEDGRQILYTTNVSDDGLRGDLVHAYLGDPSSNSTLLEDITIGISSAATCRPIAGFGGSGHGSFPIVEYCAGTDTTATLSMWRWGQKTDLVAGIATPLPFTLANDPRGHKFVVHLANENSAGVTAAVVNTRGDVEVLGPSRTQGTAFINRYGTAVYEALSEDGQSVELVLAKRHQEPTTIAAPVAGLYSNAYNRGGYSRSRVSSPNGRLALFTANFNFNTGLGDIELLQVEKEETVLLNGGPTATIGSESFTANSRFALFFDVDASTGFATLFASDRKGSVSQISGGGAFDVLQSRGSSMSYSDNFGAQPNPPPNQDPFRAFYLQTANLTVANARRPDTSNRVVAESANINYYPSHRRFGLVFTSENEAGGAGLYVASARPDW